MREELSIPKLLVELIVENIEPILNRIYSSLVPPVQFGIHQEIGKFFFQTTPNKGPHKIPYSDLFGSRKQV